MIENTLGKTFDLSRTAGEARARALLRAVEEGDATEVKTLIAGGVPADMRLPHGGTALSRAAALGFEDVALALLDLGASIDAKRDDGFTPLLVASFRGHGDVVRLLLERGADADAATRLGSTSRRWAVTHSFKDVVDAFESVPLQKHSLQSNVASVKDSPLKKNKRDRVATSFATSELYDKPSNYVEHEIESRIDQSGNMGTAHISSTSRRFASSLAIALPLIAIGGVAGYIYSYNTRTRPSLPPTPPAQVTSATPETTPAVLPQTTVGPPTSAVPSQVVQPVYSLPVITVPAESRTPSRSTGSGVPEVISERGVHEASTQSKGESGGTSERRPTPTPRPAESVRSEPGVGAEVRTGTTAPAPPSSVARPTPSATPKKKVIPWP